MGSEPTVAVRAFALVLAGAAGACAAQASARGGVLALLLGAVALALLKPWSRTAAATARPAADALAPPRDALLLQAQVLEHLPVAAWRLQGQGLQPLTVRARRLLAPGGVVDAEALRSLLLARAAAGQAGQLVLDTERGAERWQLSLQALTLDGQPQHLLALQPLENALEAERLAAWQQLVQVLTHEIMNSLTPIASLAQTAQGLDEPADRALALATIAQRAAGLQRFVADYRRVSEWPAPQLAPVDLGALLQRVAAAAGAGWRQRGGAVHVAPGAPGLRLVADEAQLEQALLNLVLNAEAATADTPQPQLWLQVQTGRGGRLRLVVRDNGPGVPPGLETRLFTPFVSGREGGRGIGLAVVRQLVHGMGGRVRHVRPLEGGAAFVLSF